VSLPRWRSDGPAAGAASAEQVPAPAPHHWGSRHLAWLQELRFDDPVSQSTFDSYFLSVQQLDERLRQLDERLAEYGGQEPYREPVAWLRCFKGIDTVTAVSLIAELHDFRRFRSARELMSYVGLVPSEHSSGDRERRGSITKSGNRHVRRLLVEAAWHHRHRPGLSAPLRRRREGQPARVLAIADRSQERLCARFRRMTARGTCQPKTIVAMARELVGYLWAVLHPAAAAASHWSDLDAFEGSDEGRHDPEDARLRCAIRRPCLPNSRFQRADPPDGSQSCGSARDAGATREY
jgi:transposase